MSDETIGGYILRISREEWLRQVFEKQKYYAGLLRRWNTGMTILLARKTDLGDSFIGYGTIGRIDMPWEAPREEQEYCEANGWRCIISFSKLVRFGEPVPLKETFLRNDKRRGKLLHGIPVTVEQLNSVLAAVGREER